MFSFILLTYNFLIMLCIDIGYTRHCVDGSFLCFIIQKIEDERILVEKPKFQQLSTMNFVDISYHYFITTHIKTT